MVAAMTVAWKGMLCERPQKKGGVGVIRHPEVIFRLSTFQHVPSLRTWFTRVLCTPCIFVIAEGLTLPTFCTSFPLVENTLALFPVVFNICDLSHVPSMFLSFFAHTKAHRSKHINKHNRNL